MKRKQDEEECPCAKKAQEAAARKPSCEHKDHSRAKEIFDKYECDRRESLPQEAPRRQSKTVTFALNDSCCPASLEEMMQSVRLQEIMMQAMRDKMEMFSKGRQTFRASMRPKQSTRRTWEEKSSCTGDVEVLEEMLCELNKELEAAKKQYNCVKKAEDERLKQEELKKKKCICGKSTWC